MIWRLLLVKTSPRAPVLRRASEISAAEIPGGRDVVEPFSTNIQPFALLLSLCKLRECVFRDHGDTYWNKVDCRLPPSLSGRRQ